MTGVIATRRVGVEAVEILAALHLQCRTAVYEESWSADAMASILGLPGVAALVAGAGGPAVVGLAVVRAVPLEAEILTLGVAPVARRRGVATALLRGMIDAGAAAGAACLLLEVAVDNRPALALYRRYGFAQLGRQRAYYRRTSGGRVDAVVMAKQLESYEGHVSKPQ